MVRGIFVAPGHSGSAFLVSSQSAIPWEVFLSMWSMSLPHPRERKGKFGRWPVSLLKDMTWK